MYRFLLALLIIAACMVGLGYYRGWFHVETDKSGSNSRISITTDNEQIKKDKATVMENMPGAGTPSKEATPAGKDN